MYPAFFTRPWGRGHFGLRTRRGLVTDKAFDDPLGSQTLGAYSLRSMLFSFANSLGP